uniref:Uncharacterized protein n=1 Tax=Meloidogyne enterolobii TaxID=390850 RepID=A0A6V7VIF8_MELEN|nr:unnamed protein product [Meloidogyne enterolobii]
MPTNDQNNATDLPTGTYEQTSEATTASNYIRTRKGFARAINRWDEYEEEEEYEKEENDGSPFVKFSEGNDSVKVREAREAIEINETTENPQTIDELSTANDLSTTTENNEAHEEEEEEEKKEEGEEDDDEQEQGEENPNPPEKEKNETKYVSNFDGEKCFITTSDKESEIFKDIYAVKGDVIYNEKQSEGIGLSTLEKLSNFKCGIKNYDQYSYCAKVKLFDTALVLIEGCFSCANSDKGPINITFWQINEAGPIKDACPAEEKLISHYILDYEKYNGGFIVGGILHERLCPARETLEDKIELAPLKYKHNFKIVIEHSCAGNKETYVSKFAKAIDFENLKEHIFELRDLNINLNQNEETFDWDWNDKKEGLGYTYFAAKEFKQSNDSEIAQGEEVMHSEYITDENEEDDDEHNDEEENDHDEEKHGEKDNHDEEKHGEVINEEKSEEENEKKKNYKEEEMKKLHEELEVVAAEVKEEDKNMPKEEELEAEEKKNESLADPEQFKENLEALNSTNEEKETNETINYQSEQITQEEEIKGEEKNPEKSDQITQEEEINEDNKEKEEEKNEENEKKEEDKDEKGKVEEKQKVDEVKKE